MFHREFILKVMLFLVPYLAIVFYFSIYYRFMIFFLLSSIMVIIPVIFVYPFYESSLDFNHEEEECSRNMKFSYDEIFRKAMDGNAVYQRIIEMDIYNLGMDYLSYRYGNMERVNEIISNGEGKFYTVLREMKDRINSNVSVEREKFIEDIKEILEGIENGRY